MRRLLVTGFGPFPTMPKNPSARIALRVAASPRWRRLDVDARALVLATAYAALDTELAPSLTEGPDAVLMLGVAGRSARIRVERRATARRSTLFPDAAGERAAGPASPGAHVRRTRVPPERVLRLLRGRDLPSRISHDAGRYLCNAAYFRALAAPAPVLFIHMPKAPRAARRAPRRMGPDGETRLVAALVDVGIALLRIGVG